MKAIEQYFNYLKEAGADVPSTADSFKKTLSDKTTAEQYYGYLKQNNFDAPDSFDSFAKTLGIIKSPTVPVKKKDGSEPISSDTPSVSVQSQEDPIPSISALLKQRKKLKAEKSAVKPTAAPGYVYTPTVDYDSQISKLDEQIKSKGYDPLELERDWSDFEVDLTDDQFGEFYNNKKTKPITTQRDMASRSWHQSVRNSISNNKDETIRIENEARLNNLISQGSQLPSQDYNTALNFGRNAIQEIISLTSGEDRDKAIANFKKDFLPVFGNILLRDRKSIANIKDLPMELGLTVSDLFDKQYADQTRSLLTQDFSDNANAMKAKERRMAEVEDLGLSVLGSAVGQEYEDNYGRLSEFDNWAKNNFDKFKELGQKISSVDPDIKSDEDIKEYNKLLGQYNSFKDAAALGSNIASWSKYIKDKKDSQFKRYPTVEADRLMELEQEWDGESVGPVGRFVSNIGSFADKAGDVLGIVYDSIFSSDEQKLKNDFERLGRSQRDSRFFNYEKESDRLYEAPLTTVFSDDIKNKLTDIDNNDSLTEDQKRTSKFEILRSGLRNGSIYQATNLNAGNINLTGKSVLNTITTVAPQILTSLGVAAATGGGATSLFVSTALQAYSEYYNEATQKGLANPNQYAMAHTLVEAGTELIGTTDLKILQKAFQGKKGFGAKFFKDLSEAELQSLMSGSKGVFKNYKQAVLRGVKSNVVEAGEEYLAGLGGNVINNELFGEDNELTAGAGEAFISTFIGQLPLTAIGIPVSVNKNNIGSKYALYNAAADLGNTMSVLKQEFDAGNITKEQYTDRVKLVTQYANAIKQSPRTYADGNPMRDDDRVKYAFNQFISNMRADKTPIPPQQKQNVDQAIANAENENDKILSNAINQSQVQEGRAEGDLGQPQGIVQGQPEVGQGEGSQGQTQITQTNVGDSNIGGQGAVVTLAPFFDTTVKTAADAQALRQTPEYKRYVESIPTVAKAFGLNVNAINETIGGFENAQGNKIVEISNRVFVDSSDLNQVEKFAAIMGTMTPETQEATIAAKFIAENETVPEGEYVEQLTVKVSDVDKSIEALQEAGIYDFTIDESDGSVSFLDFSQGTDTQFDEKITNFERALQNRNIQYETAGRSPVQSKYISPERRTELIAAIKSDAAGLQQGGESLRAIIAEAEQRDKAFRGELAKELTQELVTDPISKAAQSLKSTGVSIDLIEDPVEYDRMVEQLGGQRGTEGVFLSNEGRILLNKSKLNDAITAGRIVWHESSHPVINIIRNTNPELYNRVISGMKASDNPAVQRAIQWAKDNYQGQGVIDDESIVEAIAMVADGTLDLNTVPTGLKQSIIDFINLIARALGFNQVLNDTDVAAFKKLAGQVADVLTSGRDVAEVVGRENVKEYGVPIGVPTQAKVSDKYGPKVKHDGGSYKLSFVKPSDIIDIKGLIKEIADNGQKVWFWTADQLGRGMYYDNVIEGEHYLDAGPSFALDPKNRDKGIIWATGKGENWVNDKIANSDYIFIISGSPQKSKLFNKRVAEITFNRIKKSVGEEGSWDKFKSEVLGVSKIGKINEILNKYNSFEELLASPERKEILIQFDAQKEKKGTPLKALLEKYGAFIDYNDLRDGFFKDNDFKLNDIMLVLKPTGYGGKSAHSTYENDILGEVVGVPDRKVNAYDIMPDEFRAKYAPDMSRTEQSQAVAPYGAGVKNIQASVGNRDIITETGKKPRTLSNDIRLYHYSRSSDLSKETVDPFRVGKSQFKKRMSGMEEKDLPSGFYTTLSPNSFYGKLKRKEGVPIAGEDKKLFIVDLKDVNYYDITKEYQVSDRIPQGRLKELKDQGYDVLVGRGMIGEPELIVINKDKIVNIEKASMSDKKKLLDEFGEERQKYTEEDIDVIKSQISEQKAQASVGNRSEEDLRAEGTGKERPRALASKYGNLNPATQAKIDDDATLYFERTNKQTKEAVDKFLDGLNIMDAADYVLGNPKIPEVSQVWMAAEVAKRLNAEIDAAGNNQDLIDDLTRKQADIFNEFAKRATSLGQAVQAFIAFKDNANAVEFFLPKVLRQLKKAGVENVTEEQRAEILTLLKDVNTAAEGLPKDKAIIKLSHYLSGIAPLKPMDVLQAIWYAKILSGITTQSTNFFANIFNTVFELPAVALRISLMNGTPLGLAAGVKGFGSGVAKGAVAAADIIKSGVRSKEVDKYFAENPLEYFTWSKWLGNKGKVLDYIPPLNFGAWKYVGRILAATDALFSTANQEAIANMLAYAEAAGTPAGNNFKKANAILGNNKMSVLRAKAQAKSEGFEQGSVQYKRRVIEIIAQKRAGTQEADEIGKRITMNYDPEGFTKPLFDAVVALQKTIPAIKMVIPFARIVANLTENGLNYTPFGFAKASTGIKNPFQGLKSERLSTEQRVDLFAKFAIGMSSLAVLAANVGEDDDDWFEITAGGSPDVQKKYELQKGGWRPYTITLKDGTKISYKDWPIAGILAGVGHLRDAKKYSFDDSTQMGLYGYGFFLNMYDKSLLSGLQDFFGIFNVSAGRGKYAPDTKASERAVKYAAQQVKSVAISNLSQQTGKLYSELVTGDPQRDAKTFMQVIYRDIPSFNDGIRPIIDVFGDEVKYTTTERLLPIMASPEKEEIIEWLNKNKLFVGVPMKKNIKLLDGTERPMTDDEYYEYRKNSGKGVKKFINEFITEIKDNEIGEEAFENVVSAARQEAYAEILMKANNL